tara:strand:+ start:274 stop:474 length:201 start_codon:yes stop_codon:yes gene_type:complete
MTNENTTIKTFKSIHWTGERFYECTHIPFRKSTCNPDPEKWVECSEDELGTAQKLSGGAVEEWGWM